MVTNEQNTCNDECGCKYYGGHKYCALNQQQFKLHKPQIHQKSWGSQEWICNNEVYCGKLLKFDPGAKCSMHMHDEKQQHFYIQKGEFDINMIDLCKDGEKITLKAKPGDIIYVSRVIFHQMHNTSSEQGIIIEFSTNHDDDDSYRLHR